MTDLEKAASLALEALEGIWNDGLEGYPSSLHRNAITAIREALAEQPAQQEPIYQCQDSKGKWTDQEKHSYDYNVKHGSATVRVVYTSPQPAQQQEPVAWPCVIAEADFDQNTITLEMQCSDYKVRAGQHWLSTTPPASKPLTSAEIRKWWASENGFEDCDMAKLDDFEQVVRAVEGKHGIKGEA